MSNQMKRWVVSYINWMEYNLTSAIVYAPDWFSAVRMHPELQGQDNAEWLDAMATKDIESIKVEFFDCDSMIECVEI